MVVMLIGYCKNIRTTVLDQKCQDWKFEIANWKVFNLENVYIGNVNIKN